MDILTAVEGVGDELGASVGKAIGHIQSLKSGWIGLLAQTGIQTAESDAETTAANLKLPATLLDNVASVTGLSTNVVAGLEGLFDQAALSVVASAVASEQVAQGASEPPPTN